MERQISLSENKAAILKWKHGSFVIISLSLVIKEFIQFVPYALARSPIRSIAAPLMAETLSLR